MPMRESRICIHHRTMASNHDRLLRRELSPCTDALHLPISQERKMKQQKNLLKRQSSVRNAFIRTYFDDVRWLEECWRILVYIVDRHVNVRTKSGETKHKKKETTAMPLISN